MLNISNPIHILNHNCYWNVFRKALKTITHTYYIIINALIKILKILNKKITKTINSHKLKYRVTSTIF